MTDTTDADDASTTTGLADPRTLRDRDDVAFVENERTFGDETFGGLRERYDAIDGVVQVGATNDAGEVLLWGEETVAPPGGDVGDGEDWAAAARRAMEDLTGQRVAIDRPLLVEWTQFCRESDESECFPAPSVHFAASLVDPDPAFLEGPAVPEDFDHPMFDENPALGWHDSVPENVHENHAHHVELYVD